MEWIDTNKFVEILRRFKDRKITAYWSEDNHETRHIWSFHDGNFTHQWNDQVEQFTEDTIIFHYRRSLWRPERFFYLRTDKERELAVHIVEHLIETGNLGWIICETDIQFARQCAHCGHIFNQGWLMEGLGACYCSQECLLADYPGYTLDELLEKEEDDTEEVFWTEWYE